MEVAAIIAAIIGVLIGLGSIFVALYAMGFFNYMGGKKSNPNAINRDTLFNKIMALNDQSKPYHIIKGEDTDLVAEWKIVDAQWYGIFNKNKLMKAYRARLLLDEARHSVRCYEELGTISWSAGMKGLIPSVHYQKSSFGGRILYKKEWGTGYGVKNLVPAEAGKVYDYKFDVDEIRNPIITAAKESGWEWVPVTAKRHATYKQPFSKDTISKAEAIYCDQCGNKLHGDADFCPECGRKIA